MTYLAGHKPTAVSDMYRYNSTEYELSPRIAKPSWTLGRLLLCGVLNVLSSEYDHMQRWLPE